MRRLTATGVMLKDSHDLLVKHHNSLLVCSRSATSSYVTQQGVGALSHTSHTPGSETGGLLPPLLGAPLPLCAATGAPLCARQFASHRSSPQRTTSSIWARGAVRLCQCASYVPQD